MSLLTLDYSSNLGKYSILDTFLLGLFSSQLDDDILYHQYYTKLCAMVDHKSKTTNTIVIIAHTGPRLLINPWKMFY